MITYHNINDISNSSDTLSRWKEEQSCRWCTDKCFPSSSEDVDVGLVVNDKWTNTLTSPSLPLPNPLQQYLGFQFGENVGSSSKETKLT